MSHTSHPSINQTWIEKILCQSLKTNRKLEKIDFCELGFGKGMMSDIIVVNLEWENNSDKLLPSSVVLKIPSSKPFATTFERLAPDHAMRQQFAHVNLSSIDIMQTPVFDSHKCEVAVYELFRSFLPKQLKVPKCYYAQNMAPKQPGVLVFEDLSKSGIGGSIVDGMTASQMMQVAHSIAALHAYSLTSNFWKHPDISVNFGNMRSDIWPTMARIIETEVPKLNHIYPGLSKLYKSYSDVNYVYKLNEAMHLPDVLCHGDLHVQNMMLDSESRDLLAFIDWQFSHPGNIGEDLVRCFTSSCATDIRRKHTVAALKHYYASLKELLGEDPPFSFAQVLESYERSFKYGILLIIPVLHGYFLVNPEMLGSNPADAVKELTSRCEALVSDALDYEVKYSS